MRREISLLILILFLATFLRFWQLGSVPTGMTHDELGYSYNAYSIAKTGKNLFGEKLPLLTSVANGYASLPTTMYSMVPFFFFLPFNSTTARLPDALIGTLDVFLIYILVLSLFKNKWLALLSSFFLAISPWHLHFSRSAYDINFALFFYALAVTLFVIELGKRKIPYLSLLALLLGIFAYRGMSAMAFPLFLGMIFYSILIKADRKQIKGFLVGGIFIFVIFAGVILSVGKENYAHEATSFINDPKMQENIDQQIREARAPLLLERIFINKPMYLLDKLRENYFLSYTPDFLFLHTEGRQTYSIWSRGRIYFLDSVLIFAGFLFFARIKKKESFLPFLLLVVGGVPVALGGSPISARSFFLSFVFPIFSAGGVMFFIEFLKVFKKIILVTLIIMIYLFLLTSYLFDYYARYAYQGSEAWGKSFKDVSFVINQNKKEVKNVIWEKVTFGDFLEYSLYSKISPEEIQKVYANQKDGRFTFQNVIFNQNCGETQDSSIFITSRDCFEGKIQNSSIKDFYGNTIWKVYKF